MEIAKSVHTKLETDIQQSIERAIMEVERHNKNESQQRGELQGARSLRSSRQRNCITCQRATEHEITNQ